MEKICGVKWENRRNFFSSQTLDPAEKMEAFRDATVEHGVKRKFFFSPFVRYRQGKPTELSTRQKPKTGNFLPPFSSVTG